MSSPTKEALAKIRDLKKRLAEAESSSNEPIAIVSTACRFPRRSDTPEAFWQSLLSGTDEVTELPADRWDLDAYYDADPDAPGKMYARRGTFLENIDGMDPDFFGISPREAMWVDPQQRLFLEVSWEALERAGWAGDAGDRSTGVFVGWMHNDYQNEASERILDLNPYIATGSAGSFLCGRLSYYLGIQGPSLAIDTACSSSLVALHLACQSLRLGECDRALAGGVNVMVSPKTTIMTCKLSALSPKGHSRAFDAAADGYLRGEGCGVVTLRRLSDAERDGDNVLAVIRGSAITHNGFSSGLTAPNPDAQQRVIREALYRAGVAPLDIDYLEAHGTGTELGDPIELNAAAAVLGEGRTDAHPLLVGSVKTNLGHLEAAAGIAGIIKTVLALQHRRLPAHLHFENPNPHIAWDRLPVEIVTGNRDWPESETPRAGVSAFGMSGTNAHVVIEAPPSKTSSVDPIALAQAGANGNGRHPGAPNPLPLPLFLSGKTEAALQESAARLRSWLEESDASLSPVCRAAAIGRRHFEQRAVLLAGERREAGELLASLERGEHDDRLITGTSRPNPRVAWQFSGQGSQYVGMGRALYDTEPVFREQLDACSAELTRHREGDLVSVIFNAGSHLGDTFWTQPALFAIHLSLAELMKRRGLAPDFVLGHSLGQYAAACIAGMVDWRDCLRLIHERSRLTGSLPAGGAMAAIFAGGDSVGEAIRSDPALSLAAHNGSHSVISGPEKSVDAAIESLAGNGIRTKRLDTSHAFHSSLLEPILDEFEQVADSLSWRSGKIPLICNVTGEVMPAAPPPRGSYWRRQLREAVQYERSISTLASLGCDVILELGPQPILTGMAASCWSGSRDALVSTLSRDTRDDRSLLETTARLHVNGVALDLASLFGAGDGTPSPILPTYPFQRQRHWGPERPGAARVKEGTQHPLLGEERSLAGVQNEVRFENRISPDRQHWLGDHRVFEDIVFPGAASVEMALASTRGALAVEHLAFEMPLLVGDSSTVQTVVRRQGDEGHIEIYSRQTPGDPWQRNVSASLAPPIPEKPPAVNRSEFEARCPETADVGAFYEAFASLGIQYGTEFQTIQSLQFSRSEVLTRLRLEGERLGFHLPPMLLDGAFQSLAAGLLTDPESPLFLPAGIERFEQFATVPSEVWCHGSWHESEGEVRTADLTLFDGRGLVIARIEKLRVRAVNRTALRQMVGSTSERLLYSVQWRPASLPAPDTRPSQWIIAGEDPEWNDRIASALEEKGQACLRVSLLRDSEGDPRWEASSAVIGAESFAHWDALFDHYFPGEEPGRVNGIIWSTGSVVSDLPAGNDEAHTRLHCAGLLTLLQGLRARRIEWLDRGLQIVTERAVPATPDVPVSPGSAQFWGIGRVIGNEYPPLRGRLVDTDDVSRTGALVPIFLTESRESQVALRSGETVLPRLLPAKAPDPGEGLPVRDDASYLITGGLGMLGRRAAEWLADRGARHLVLVSRRAPDEETQSRIDKIEETGCQVHVLSCDTGDRESVAALLKQIEETLPPLRGIIHAAGVLADGLLVEQSWEGFERVLAPKKRGAALLDEFTRNEPLNFFLLYSSAASVLGSPGQANYATANAYLDGLAHARSASGLPTYAVNFGPWNEGMAATETVTKAVELQGMTALTADEAHEAVERLVKNGITQATMLDVDWGRMRQRFPVEAPPLLDELWPNDTGEAGSAVLLDKLREAGDDGASRGEIFMTHVQEELRQVLSLPQPPGPDVPLAELGLDSLMAVEFATRLQQQVGSGYAIPPTLAFDYPTVAQLTERLVEMIDEVPEADEPETVAARTDEESVVIVGMGCRFPGADGIEAYWDLLREGRDATVEIPGDRWDMERLYAPEPSPGKMYVNRGGFLPDIDEFDATFFGLTERDATWMDPQHRMLLEVSWHALENAGVVPGEMTETQVGVFMGIMSTDYAQLRERLDPGTVDGAQGAGLSHSAGVGRISYLFGFEGPSIAVDTASSSSLVAVCQAVRSLLDGDCHVALAGGVNAILSPINSLLLCKGGVLSPDGRCKSFSSRADGFGRGEGCGVVVLKRRSDAERDGDRILATIRGTAIGHNGHNGGLTAPSGRSQQQMIRRALETAGLSPADLDYLEAHATGTELGDTIELQAAADVYGKGRDAAHPLLVGSAKANLSHLEAAGGISGLIKVVLSMQHGLIPRQIHCDEPTPHIAWDRVRARVVTEEAAWPHPDRPIAGVSALGMTGTNAHVILEGEPDVTHPSEPSPPRDELLVVTARTPSALRELAGRYADRLSRLAPSDFPSFCDAAASQRRHFEHRTAFVTRSAGEARETLRRLAHGEAGSGITGVKDGSPRMAWVFSSTGILPVESGRILAESEPAFRRAWEVCGSALEEEGGQPIDAVLADGSLAGQPEWRLALSCAWQLALTSLFRNWGIEPDAVVGDETGLFAAAAAAGTIPPESAVRLAFRSGLLADPAARTPEALDAFEAFVDTFDLHPPDRPLVCGATGSLVPVYRVLTGTHWREHLGKRAASSALADALFGEEIDLVLAVGGDDSFANELVDAAGESRPTAVIGVARPGEFERVDTLSALGHLFVAGCDPDFAAFVSPRQTRRIDLPPYPFQRKHYWLDSPAIEATTRDVTPADNLSASGQA